MATNPALSKHSIRDTLNEHFKDLKIDARWVNLLSRFRIGFTIRNEAHMKFFGGNLFGTEVVRFTINDRDYIFEELLDSDEASVDYLLSSLPNINKNFKVTGDALNNVFIWLLYRLHNTKSITNKQREQAMMDVGLLMNYRFYTSLLSHYFRKYPADPKVATAMYAGLSKRYEIKRLGNWNRVFEERVRAFISRDSIHYHTITTMDDDIGGVRYAISDAQGRIRSMFRFLMAALVEAQKEGEQIRTESALMEHEGEQILKDRVRSLQLYGNYLKSVIVDKHAFIKQPLVVVVEKAMPTMPPKLFMQTLESLVDHAKRDSDGAISEIINETLTHAFAYLYQNRQLVRNTSDLSGILTKLRGTYSSSRNVDQQLLRLRERIEDYIRVNMKVRHAGNIAATRTGVLLYLVARAMTMNYFSR